VKLIAHVRHITGSTSHGVVGIDNVPISRLEAAVTVEITGSEVGFLLIRHSTTGYAGDTWHLTIEEAKRQAEVEFGINPEDWRSLPSA
jgi:hypothetical protein